MERELRRWRRWRRCRRLRSCSVRLETPEIGQVNDPERPRETNSLSSPHMNKLNRRLSELNCCATSVYGREQGAQESARPPGLSSNTRGSNIAG